MLSTTGPSLFYAAALRNALNSANSCSETFPSLAEMTSMTDSKRLRSTFSSFHTCVIAVAKLGGLFVSFVICPFTWGGEIRVTDPHHEFLEISQFFFGYVAVGICGCHADGEKRNEQLEI